MTRLMPSITEGRSRVTGKKRRRLAIIAVIEPGGRIMNERNQRIGFIHPDGRVMDDRGSPSNERIGNAPGVKKEWVAAFFFFFEFKN